jgi:hypothetical protein
MHPQPIKKGPRPHPPRDGDRNQARRRVQHLYRAGRLPHPSTLPCTDCGQPASQYDHYLGYDAIHHLDVQAVCGRCHDQRSVARGEKWLGGNKPKTTACTNCGRAKPPYRHGRCEACRWYWNTHGRERPIPSS